MDRPAAEVLTIGNEVLKGQVLNTNAKFLGQELLKLGFSTRHQSSCPDEIPEIKKSIGAAFSRSQLIICSGGLGPTPDDVTRDAIAEYFGKKLLFSKSQYQLIRTYYKTRGRKVPEIVKREAQFPEGSVPLVNHYGIALGFYIESRGRILVSLPGVPGELERMFESLVRPVLKKRFPELSKKSGFVIKMAGISEPEVMRRLGTDFFKSQFDFGIYPDYAEVAIRIQAERPSLAKMLFAKAKKRLLPFIYSFEEVPLREAIGKLLAHKRKTIACAESCTGGLLASEICKVAGASKYFKGGVIAYQNKIKTRLLSVLPKDLEIKGAVSKEVARQMAAGARCILSADIGVGITGIAGPGSGSRKKPVGLVYIAISTSRKDYVYEEKFWGERTQIQNKSAKKALQHLWQILTDKK